MNGYGFPWCRHPGLRDNGGYAVPQFRGFAGWDKTPCLPSFMSAGEFPEMIRQSYGSCRLRGEGWRKPRRGCILLPGNHSHFPTHRAAECSPSLVRPLRSRDHRKPNLRRLPRVPKSQGISHKPARPGMVDLPCLAMRPTRKAFAVANRT